MKACGPYTRLHHWQIQRVPVLNVQLSESSLLCHKVLDMRECPLRQTPCRRETKAGRILLTGVLLTLVAVSSLLLAGFLRMWEHWKLDLLLTLLGIVFCSFGSSRPDIWCYLESKGEGRSMRRECHITRRQAIR